MAESEALEIAKPGDHILGADLQDSIDRLLALASGLDPLKAEATEVEVVQAIGRAQQRLRSMAMGLVNRQIDLIADRAKVTAKHVNAAAKAAEETIARIAEIRKHLRTIGKLLDFFAVVLTGNGEKIVEAAFELKDVLDAG
jgi:hypothetical protein